MGVELQGLRSICRLLSSVETAGRVEAGRSRHAIQQQQGKRQDKHRVAGTADAVVASFWQVQEMQPATGDAQSSSELRPLETPIQTLLTGTQRSTSRRKGGWWGLLQLLEVGHRPWMRGMYEVELESKWPAVRHACHFPSNTVLRTYAGVSREGVLDERGTSGLVVTELNTGHGRGEME